MKRDVAGKMVQACIITWPVMSMPCIDVKPVAPTKRWIEMIRWGGR